MLSAREVIPHLDIFLTAFIHYTTSHMYGDLISSRDETHFKVLHENQIIAEYNTI